MKRIPLFLATLILCAQATILPAHGQLPALAAKDEVVQAPLEEGAASEPQEKPDFLVRNDFVIEKIRSNIRQVDPFGLAMDPTNMVDSVALAAQYEDLEETATVITNSALKNALQTLPITGIYPLKQTIVLGPRSFSAGGIFGMKLEDLTIRLRFEGIKDNSVYFKDLDTQEVATVEFNTRPATFEPITRNSAPLRGKGIEPMEELFIVN